jgi:glucose/arabinose dehydrogenase/mono/diheme cytochrome c family protein
MTIISSRPFLSLSLSFVIFLGQLTCSLGQQKQAYPTDKKALSAGLDVFTTNCVSCHDLKNEGIGPRLGGVTSVLSQKQLTDFIQDASKVINSGDRRASALSRKYKLTMPPFDFLKPAEIKAVLAYIDHETRTQKIGPLPVVEDKAIAGQTVERLGVPVTKSGLKIELGDFVQIPPSDEKKPLTRIANMRPHPSGDGSLFISDQRGIIYLLSKGQTSIFLDIRTGNSDYINAPGLGTGLGSFAFHPDYLNNGLIYITHTEKFTGKKADYEYADTIHVEMQWVLSELKMSNVNGPVFAGEKRELLRINVPSPVHGTQDIEFIPGISKRDPDYGLLFMGTGDGGSTISKHPELCHDLKSLLGTIIRIDPLGRNSANGKYGIPADNPFVGNTDPFVRKEIYAYGFRNPHRLSWDLTNGKTMFSAEVGETNFEEVNVIVKGGDYGWNQREGKFGISYKDLKNVYKLKPGEKGNFIDPFAAYDHIDGNAISGGYVYEGKIAALKHKYVFGDIVNGKLFYVNINKQLSDSTIHELTIVQNSKETDLVQMSNSRRVDVRIEYDHFTKEMYIMTKSDGKIRKITNAFFDKKP